MLPFESVEMTGTWTATGVAGSVVVWTGEGVMIMLSDGAVCGMNTTGGVSLVACRTAERALAAVIVGAFTAWVVVVVGATSPAA